MGWLRNYELVYFLEGCFRVSDSLIALKDISGKVVKSPAWSVCICVLSLCWFGLQCLVHCMHNIYDVAVCHFTVKIWTSGKNGLKKIPKA
ncbi:hypothetical protein BDR05DRAFT_537116 [Suillus weaverae]|nr:hypothetical protein BDR05DRAFT_537116 [Suillus weaverae]